MKIGYFADGLWSHLALEKILKRNEVEIAFICVRNDSTDSVLPKMAEELKVPCLRHPKINSDDFIDMISAFNCDIYVSMSFDQIFKKRILESVPKGIINCHAGKLPFYRGRNVLNWVLINDEKEFGITVHHVDEGIDTGDIILQKVFPITDEDDYSTLLEKAYAGCADLLDQALALIVAGDCKRIKQESIHPVGTYCGKRSNGDEVINWHQSSRDLFNFVRAICDPGPQARTTFRGDVVKINRIVFIKDAPGYKGTPGQILGKTSFGWLVKTLDSFVEIREVTVAGDVKIRVGEKFV